MGRLHIIASCTDRKTLEPALRLRDVLPANSVAIRANEWWNRLTTLTTDEKAAIDVYAGDHWSIVRSLPALAETQGWQSALWVMSAGYGLVPAEARIRGYSATFAFGHEDSVGDADACVEWWKALSEFELPRSSAPRNLRSLIAGDPSGVFLFIGSPNYLRAAGHDLLTGVAASGGNVHALVISSPRGLKGTRLTPFLVESEAAVQHAVGGLRASLHARVARLIVREARSHEFDLYAVQRLVHGLTVPGSGQMPQRIKQSDAAVRAFIRSALCGDASLACTPLLKRLRNAGLACEMRRFKLLYAEEREEKAAAHAN